MGEEVPVRLALDARAKWFDDWHAEHGADGVAPYDAWMGGWDVATARLVGERDELAARVKQWEHEIAERARRIWSLEETLTTESKRLQEVAGERNELAGLLREMSRDLAWINNGEVGHYRSILTRARAILDRSTPE